MKKSIVIFLLFIGQMYFCIFGRYLFGIYLNPFFLFSISTLIAGIYFYSVTGNISKPRSSGRYTQLDLIFLILLAASLIVSFVLYISLFKKYNGTYIYSDIIPQIDALYDRFARGEQPYYPVTPPSHSPFPVYMPLHWLPVGFARMSGLDLRLIGLIMLDITIVIYALFLIKRFNTIWSKALIIIMPVLIPVAFYLSPTVDLTLNFETPIAAYYLILGIGFYRRNIWMTTLGIICCLMSRYTLFFWLPLFAILLWVNIPRKQNLIVWASVIAAIFLIYIFPFALRAPTAFLSGIKYHNGAAIGQWTYVSDTFDLGIYFAPHMKAIFSGDMEHRVLCARIVQASVMLFLFFGGLFSYRRIRAKVNFYDFALGSLYLVMLCFYMIGPLTYRYYFLPLFFITVLLCARIIENSEADGLDPRYRHPV